MGNTDNKYLIVSANVLPDYFTKVIEARELIENGEMSISRACKEKDISRSTFYKYKDYIFRPIEKVTRKCIFTFKMADEKGVLSKILSTIYKYNVNIITITQAMPIKNCVYVTITIDISDTDVNLQELNKKIKQIPFVKSAKIVSFE